MGRFDSEGGSKPQDMDFLQSVEALECSIPELLRSVAGEVDCFTDVRPPDDKIEGWLLSLLLAQRGLLDLLDE